MNEQKYFFKVKTGFKPHECEIIEAGPTLEKAWYAFVMADETVVMLNGRAVRGKHIMGIEPDVHSYTGWFRNYEPKNADDYAQIKRDVPKEIERVNYLYQQHVAGLIESNNVALLGRQPLKLSMGTDEQLQLGSG
jgi:hypothetical protein